MDVGKLCRTITTTQLRNVKKEFSREGVEWGCPGRVIREKGELKLKIENESIQGHEKSLALIKKILRLIKSGLFVVRNIEFRKEIIGDGWRVVVYLRQTNV